MEKNKVSLEPIEKRSLYLKISDSIYSYIRINKLQPEDKLPSERDMSAMLQTSRNSVREALRILEDRGLIYVKTGRGVFIKDPCGEKSTFSLCLDDCSLTDIRELQNTLEHQAVQNAIQRATKEQKEVLIAIASELVRLSKNSQYSHTLDHSFHNKLYEIGDNTAIQQLIIKIREDRFVKQLHLQSRNHLIWLPTIPNHLILANAISAGDSTLAIKAIDEINNFGYLQLENEM